MSIEPVSAVIALGALGYKYYDDRKTEKISENYIELSGRLNNYIQNCLKFEILGNEMREHFKNIPVDSETYFSIKEKTIELLDKQYIIAKELHGSCKRLIPETDHEHRKQYRKYQIITNTDHIKAYNQDLKNTKKNLEGIINNYQDEKNKNLKSIEQNALNLGLDLLTSLQMKEFSIIKNEIPKENYETVSKHIANITSFYLENYEISKLKILQQGLYKHEIEEINRLIKAKHLSTFVNFLNFFHSQFASNIEDTVKFGNILNFGFAMITNPVIASFYIPYVAGFENHQFTYNNLKVNLHLANTIINALDRYEINDQILGYFGSKEPKHIEYRQSFSSYPTIALNLGLLSLTTYNLSLDILDSYKESAFNISGESILSLAGTMSAITVLTENILAKNSPWFDYETQALLQTAQLLGSNSSGILFGIDVGKLIADYLVDSNIFSSGIYYLLDKIIRISSKNFLSLYQILNAIVSYPNIRTKCLLNSVILTFNQNKHREANLMMQKHIDDKYFIVEKNHLITFKESLDILNDLKLNTNKQNDGNLINGLSESIKNLNSSNFDSARKYLFFNLMEVLIDRSKEDLFIKWIKDSEEVLENTREPSQIPSFTKKYQIQLRNKDYLCLSSSIILKSLEISKNSIEQANIFIDKFKDSTPFEVANEAIKNFKILMNSQIETNNGQKYINKSEEFIKTLNGYKEFSNLQSTLELDCIFQLIDQNEFGCIDNLIPKLNDKQKKSLLVYLIDIFALSFLKKEKSKFEKLKNIYNLCKLNCDFNEIIEQMQNYINQIDALPSITELENQFVRTAKNSREFVDLKAQYLNTLTDHSNLKISFLNLLNDTKIKEISGPIKQKNSILNLVKNELFYEHFIYLNKSERYEQIIWKVQDDDNYEIYYNKIINFYIKNFGLNGFDLEFYELFDLDSYVIERKNKFKRIKNSYSEFSKKSILNYLYKISILDPKIQSIQSDRTKNYFRNLVSLFNTIPNDKIFEDSKIEIKKSILRCKIIYFDAENINQYSNDIFNNNLEALDQFIKNSFLILCKSLEFKRSFSSENRNSIIDIVNFMIGYTTNSIQKINENQQMQHSEKRTIIENLERTKRLILNSRKKILKLIS